MRSKIYVIYVIFIKILLSKLFCFEKINKMSFTICFSAKITHSQATSFFSPNISIIYVQKVQNFFIQSLKPTHAISTGCKDIFSICYRFTISDRRQKKKTNLKVFLHFFVQNFILMIVEKISRNTFCLFSEQNTEALTFCYSSYIIIIPSNVYDTCFL